MTASTEQFLWKLGSLLFLKVLQRILTDTKHFAILLVS